VAVPSSRGGSPALITGVNSPATDARAAVAPQ